MANGSLVTLAESLEAAYLGVATDPIPDDHYTVAVVLVRLPTAESEKPLYCYSLW
jgi:hypothetical protein